MEVVMAFTKDGYSKADGSGTVVYQLKSSSGQVLKTYNVKLDEIAQFESLAQAEKEEFSKQYGEVSLIKLQKLF